MNNHKGVNNMTIQEARKLLGEELQDSEGYHGKFDDIIEARLRELDPEFMDAMDKLYELSGCSRWYA